MFNDKTAKFLLLAAIVICVGGAFAPNWIVNQFMFGFSRALAILGLMVLWRTGLVSFGHAFYFGLGAYAVAILDSEFGVSDVFLRLLAGAVVAGFAGFLIGFIDLNSMLSFLLISICSLPVARLVRLPMPHLLGPLLISSACHILGLVEIPRISEFVIMAQIVIGASVGARLARVPFRQLAMYIRDAIVNSAIVLSTYGFTAYCLAALTNIDFIKMLLAFIPGGLYEVTLLALIFGFDIAFVAFHHTIRVIMVFLGLPFIITFAERRNLINRNTKSSY